jgi:acyl-CoA dehydrogenase
VHCLDWPFFEARHRALARDLEAWAVLHVSQEHAADVDAACRALVKSLGAGGWLKHAVGDVIDTRAICLIRETLARHSGLADFAFAMQLGRQRCAEGSLPAARGARRGHRSLRLVRARRRL